MLNNKEETQNNHKYDDKITQKLLEGDSWRLHCEKKWPQRDRKQPQTNV